MDSPSTSDSVAIDVDQQRSLLQALHNRPLTPTQFAAWTHVYDAVHRGYPTDSASVAALRKLVTHTSQ